MTPVDEEYSMTLSCLPEYIQQAIALVIKEHPEYLTPVGSRGKCGTASDQLLYACDQLLHDYANGYVDGLEDYNGLGPHYWACIDGFCIDITARQFDAKADCPKIWKLEDWRHSIK